MKNFELKGLEIVKMIRVSFNRGSGTIEDKIRIVHQYFDSEGRFVFEFDPERQN